MFVLQETMNSNLLGKNCTQKKVRCHIQHEESWLRWIVIKQVNYYFPLCTLSKPIRKKQPCVFWENEGKMHEGGWVKEFSLLTSGWYLATSLYINFSTDNFQGFWVHETFRIATSSSCIKCLISTCEILF